MKLLSVLNKNTIRLEFANVINNIYYEWFLK